MVAAPTATYRLQFRPGFGFGDAARLADYLSDLGISHVYTSPILQAAPGSSHGYDVIDHTRVSANLGGEAGFRAMAAAFGERGIGLVVDLVPNHMAIPDPPSLNRPFWSVVTEGRESPYARWFDIDWSAGRVVLPNEGTVNYRRFFDISSLIALRVEDPEVFEATHAVPLRLMSEGLIDGLRIDHPDGLADPRGYLRMLTARTGGRGWVVAEKILIGDERLPVDWPCAGTTGYDALGIVGGLFNDPAGEKPMTDLYASLTGTTGGFAETERTARRLAAERILVPEMDRLHRLLASILADVPSAELRRIMEDLLVALPVYRVYVVPGETPPAEAADVLRAASPPGELAERVVAVALGRDGRDPARDEFVVRFGQTSAPLMAKGVEDTALYRWSRLTSLNEVGGDPTRFAVGPADFHHHCRRIARDWPASMTTLSTHDTKRQEDVRARLAALTELPAEWGAALARWRSRRPSPLEPDLENLMWQTVVGAWPIDLDRLTTYLSKAMREAKTRTSWTEPDPAYESSVLAYVSEVLADEELIGDIAGFVARLAPLTRVNVLGQKLVQLTMPGVPDVYQGCELTGLSLVDPDNRRPVDYARRRDLLAALPVTEGLDAEKLLVTARALGLRRDHPDWFAGGYEALAARGPAAGHVLAFRRGGAITAVTRLAAGIDGWAETVLDLPAGRWHDVLTNQEHFGATELAELFGRGLPVALLKGSLCSLRAEHDLL